MMQPGSALLIIAVLAFLLRFVVSGLPLVGGLLDLFLLFVIAFGVIGGIYLLILDRRRPA
jgi:hypothetical protein